MTQPPKAFTYAGKTPFATKDYLFLLIGILGGMMSLYGLSQSPAQLYYVAGSSCLLVTAIYFRLLFFIALEIILISGHGAILLGIGSVLQFAIPVLLCLQLLVFYYLSNQINNLSILIGIAGIAVLSIGLAYENQWVFFSGSSAIAFYAFSSRSKNNIAWLWGILNILFALIAIIKIVTLG